MAVSANRLELLQIADAVAREKSIDKFVVLEAMEEAIQKAARSRYGSENEIRAEIDPKTGDIRLYRLLEVVEMVENDATQIPLEEALARNPAAQVGDFLSEALPPLDFGRIAAQTAKQVIVQKVRDAERDRQYEEYKDRIGEIVNGIVKRVEYGNVVVDLGRAEAIMRRDEGLPRETFHNGDRARAYVYDVRREARGPQIFLSRTHPQFMAKLFAQEVPEVYDGVIEIKAVARDPSSRAKIAVISRDSSIDPVGACVGMRGSRVQAVVGELQGEKIDIIEWSPDPATFIVNALAPAEVSKVVLDEDTKRIEVVVPDDQLSLAIGRRGQNVRLASQLTGWDIDILTEAEESTRRQEEFRAKSEMFARDLDVEETIAQLLAAEGFTSIEEVAYVAEDELSGIQGFDEEIAGALQARAREKIDERDARFEVERKEMGVEDAVAALPNMTPSMLVVLGKAGVKTLDDFADLATDELTSPKDGLLKDFDLDDATATEMVMAARAHWFADEEEDDEQTSSDAIA
ncbi:transcription termination/antitermination protein NusA [Oleomonas cavernae]|uniref:Transcription termination/antitermination protein NusA n=1 Tax=Oleomonas cavernae TaxID=2320859 RepID=A0A418WHT4_9PROT|nr:transcription termination factor NusA [Oleomonas cavernae]RJF89560.1 transcription termination/antitermination protein NusA [Oleomonas cavernae]